jgi:hypothetical protein
MKALKMRAVQDNKRFSKVAEDALRQYLRFPKEEESTTAKKKRGGTNRHCGGLVFGNIYSIVLKREIPELDRISVAIDTCIRCETPLINGRNMCTNCGLKITPD